MMNKSRRYATSGSLLVLLVAILTLATCLTAFAQPDPPPPPPPKPDPGKYFLLGISNPPGQPDENNRVYDDVLSPHFPWKDVAKKNRVLPDNAWGWEIKDWLRDMITKTGKDAFLLFFYSGHTVKIEVPGQPDTYGIGCKKIDEQTGEEVEDYVTREELAAEFKKVDDSTTLVVIFNSCQTDVFVNYFSADQDLQKKKNMLFLGSTAGDGKSGNFTMPLMITVCPPVRAREFGGKMKDEWPKWSQPEPGDLQRWDNLSPENDRWVTYSEPGSMLVLGSGLIGLAGVAIRRRR